jgi:hypothetical protein
MDAAAIAENAPTTTRERREITRPELVRTKPPAFPTIAWKTLRVSHSAHRPLLTHTQNLSFVQKQQSSKGHPLVEAMENALPGFLERSVVKPGRGPLETLGRFPQPRIEHRDKPRCTYWNVRTQALVASMPLPALTNPSPDCVPRTVHSS